LSRSGLGVTGVMTGNSLRQKTLSTTLTTPRKGGATSFGSHPGPKTVLSFARSFRSLVGAFHKTEKFARRELRAVTLGWQEGLSMSPVAGTRSESLVASRCLFWNKQCKEH